MRTLVIARRDTAVALLCCVSCQSTDRRRSSTDRPRPADSRPHWPTDQLCRHGVLSSDRTERRLCSVTVITVRHWNGTSRRDYLSTRRRQDYCHVGWLSWRTHRKLDLRTSRIRISWIHAFLFPICECVRIYRKTRNTFCGTWHLPSKSAMTCFYNYGRMHSACTKRPYFHIRLKSDDTIVFLGLDFL